MADSGFADIESERSAVAENIARARSSNMFRMASTPDLAATVSAVAEMYPNIAPSVIVGGALSGLSAYEEMWGELDTRSKEDRDDRWAGSDFAPLDYMLDIFQGTYGLGRAAIRGGMIFFDTLWEEGVSHPLRGGVTAYQNPQLSLGSAWNEASPSSGLRALGEFFNDPVGNLGSSAAHYMNLYVPFADPFEVSTQARVNLGSGFFANSDLVEADDYRVEQLTKRGWTEDDAMAHLTDQLYGSPSTLLFRKGANAVQVTGRNGVATGVSPGRMLAMTVMEPGTSQFNVLSGTMDFGAQVFLDPSNVVGAWMGKARLASRAMRQFDEAPGVLSGLRNSVLLNDVDKALSSSRGQGMLDFLSNTDDLALIDSIISPATRTRGASNELLRQIQVTNNPQQMYDVIRQATGREIIRKPWNYSVTSGLLGGTVSGGTMRGRSLQSVNRAVNTITGNKMAQSANYRGFQPNLRTRYLDGTILHDAATGRISRGYGGRNRRATGRLFSQMVGDRIDVSNLDNGIRQMRDMTRNLDLTPTETQRVLNRFVNLGNGDLNGAMYVLETAMVPYRKKLHKAGVSQEVIDRMTTVYKDQDEMHKYFVNGVGDDETIGSFEVLMGNGQKLMIPQSHTMSEMSGTFLAVPGGPRQIRRMTDFIKRTEGSKWWTEGQRTRAHASWFYDAEFQSRVAVRAADSLIQGVWKPMVLLRPAWTLRVVGEEQLRMAAADLSSFNHPMRAFITALTDKNLKLGLTTRKQLYKSDVYGDALSLATDYQAAMSRSGSTWFDSPGGYGAQKWIKVELGDAGYDKWWFRELNQLQSDKVSNDLARMMSDPSDARNYDDVLDSFMDGDLAPFRDRLRNDGTSMRHQQLATREGSDAYLRSLEARIHLKTGGHYEVLKDDGWWYDDVGMRLRQETSSEGIASSLPVGRRGVRVSTRTVDEYENTLRRSGMSEDEVGQKMKLLQTKGIVDDASFNKLDPDARTLLLPEHAIVEDDILSEARTLQYRITEQGNEELLSAIATGDLRGANFAGEVNGQIQRDVLKQLESLRGTMTPPQFVKGVDESNVGMLDNIMDKGFDMFMGKPTNRYSRSPVFMRSYWNTVSDLADQGLIDENTLRKLEKLLGRKGKTVTTQNVRRALRHTEAMDDAVSNVEKSYVRLEDAFNNLDPSLAPAMEPTLTRLKKLVDGEHYDVGRYNRILKDMEIDLNDLQTGLVDSLSRAIADEGLDVARREDLVRTLHNEIDEMENQLSTLRRLGTEDVEEIYSDLDIMYEAMGKMPEEYIDGLVPHPRPDAPSDLETAITSKVDDLHRAEPLDATTTRGVVEPHVGGTPLEPLVTKIDSAGKWGAETPWGKVKIWRTGKGRKQKWQVVLPEGMPLPASGSRRSIHRTKAEAEAVLREHWDTLGTSRVYETRPTTIAGVEQPRMIDELEPRTLQTDTNERISKMRNDLGANEEQVRAMETARFEQGEDLSRAERQAEEGRAFLEVLPSRENRFMSLNEVDSLAKAAALTETQQLLYDLSKRSNFSDMMRNIFPFAEAWWEIVSTWSRLVQGNPRTLQRFQQAYMGFSEDVVLPEGAYNIEGHDGQGFFYVDPRTDREMFAIPYLSDALQGNTALGTAIGAGIGGGLGGLFAGGFGMGVAGAAVGAGIGAAAGYGTASAGLVPEGESVELAFSTQGVNMATQSAIPGISPIAALPVSWIIDRTPDAMNDALTELFLPFGEPAITQLGDIIDNSLPAYFKRFFQAIGKGDEDMQRIRANTTMEVAAMMVRRGEGSFSTPEDIQKTLDVASKKSGWLYAIRGLATFAGPTAPVFQYSSETDENGAWFYTNTMMTKWQETLEAHEGDSVSAFDEFTGLYGLSPQTYMTGKTKTVRPHPLTEKAYAWKLENEDIYKKFPGTANLLNPINEDTDEFSYEAYLESLETGARVPYGQKEWAEKSNQLAANIIMARFQKAADAFMAGSSHKQVDQMKVDEQLFALKWQLIEDYPGYGRQIMGSVAYISFDEKLLEIEKWTPEMKNSESGKGIVAYMAARKEAEAIGVRQGFSRNWWLTSAEGRTIRDQVLGIATSIRAQNPAFRWAWVTMFSSEMSEHLDERDAA